jgi:hypothetical protein
MWSSVKRPDISAGTNPRDREVAMCGSCLFVASYVLAATVVVLPPVPAVPPTVNHPVLAITPEVRTISVGDPLLVKATFSNPSKAVVMLDKDLSVAWAGLGFEVQPPGEAKFVPCYAIGQGLACGLTPKKTVKPGESRVEYAVLFWGIRKEDGPIFSTPGRWQLRATCDAEGGRLVSATVSIEVQRPGARSIQAFDACSELLRAAVYMYGRSPPEDLAILARAKKDLGSTNAAAVIRQNQVLADLRLAGPARARAAAIDAIRKLRVDLPPVTREHFDLQLATVFLHRREYDDAEVLLKGVRENGYMLEKLCAQLKEEKQKSKPPR